MLCNWGAHNVLGGHKRKRSKNVLLQNIFWEKENKTLSIAVQEMSLTYNSEDELMNQSFHSLTSLGGGTANGGGSSYSDAGGSDSVRSHTPSVLETSIKVGCRPVELSK